MSRRMVAAAGSRRRRTRPSGSSRAQRRAQAAVDRRAGPTTAQSAVEVFLAVVALLLLGRDLRRAWRDEFLQRPILVLGRRARYGLAERRARPRALSEPGRAAPPYGHSRLGSCARLAPDAALPRLGSGCRGIHRGAALRRGGLRHARRRHCDRAARPRRDRRDAGARPAMALSTQRAAPLANRGSGSLRAPRSAAQTQVGFGMASASTRPEFHEWRPHPWHGLEAGRRPRSSTPTSRSRRST